MGKQSTPSIEEKEALFGPDLLAEGLRGKIREMILALVEEEFLEVLSARPYERCEGRRRDHLRRRRWKAFGRVHPTLP